MSLSQNTEGPLVNPMVISEYLMQTLKPDILSGWY